ncbi:MAG: hypothetical protein MI799_14460 [Desulfobacterales bacterium]|nr:hypothetical protein [Desulfobacterales bacterium]
MKGNVYTRQKCSICNARLVHSEKKNGCFCERHANQQATGQFYVKFGKDINRRFRTYDEAARFLTGLRYETDIGTFDVRDHLASNPLSFSNLAEQYLSFKEKQQLASFYHIKRYMMHASRFFKDVNVKSIKRKHIRNFLDTLDVSDKTKKNYATQLHDFWYNFLYEEEEILNLSQLPKFPQIDVQLGFRKLVDIETREKIVDTLKERTYNRSPKIWLGVDLLCTYNSLRPGDLRSLKEGDIDLEYGVLTFWRPTKSKKRKDPKVIRIRLIDFHVNEFKKMKQAYPAVDSVLFFRSPNGEPFGINLFYKHWKKACKELGIYDLDLYGGTRHSSITAIAKAAGKEKARKYSGHLTNKAFDRYCQIGDDDTFDISQLMAEMRGKVVSLKDAKKFKK